MARLPPCLRAGLAACALAGAAPAMTVSFTFDDAHGSHLTETAPLLERHGFRGLFCVPTDWVGQPGRLTWDDVRELRRRGHGVVPHGAAHVDLAALLRRGEKEAVRRDLRRARDAMRAALGEAPRLVCLPFNACEAAQAAQLKVVPYEVAHPAGSRCASPLRGVLCLTFDDGCYASWRAALPVFARHGATATFFAMGALDDRQVGELRHLRAHGHTVGLHTMRHGDAPAQADAAAHAAWADREVAPQARRAQEAGLPVYAFAYPNNCHTPEMDAYLARRFGFTHFRAGAELRYGFAGDVDAATVQRFATVDDAFKPVEWCFWKPVMNGIGLGPVYCYSRENVFGALRRAAERNEIVTFFSHSISAGEPDRVGMKIAWVEEILAEADRLGLAVLGFDDLGRQ